jgi:hypothetical protein
LAPLEVSMRDVSLLRGLAYASLCLALACEGGPAAPDADPGPDTTGETFTVTLGPIDVPAGFEDTQCVEKRLTNAEAKWIGKLHTHLQGVSHHLIVYRVASTEERLEPFPCTPFLETLDPDAGSPLMVSQIPDETLDFPYGVAIGIEPGQMVRLEMHFVNPTDQPATVSAEVVFEVLPPEQFRAEAGFLFIGNPDIELQPGPATLGPVWFPIPAELEGVKIFGMTGHTHQWGTNVDVEWRPHEDGADEAVPAYRYAAWDWEEPPMAFFKPALEMTPDSGFRFSCSWNNLSGQTVGFGESAGDEMCFFWAYYYPTQGHKVCAHTDQLGFPLNLCCPGPDQLCDMIRDQLGI